MKYFYICLLLLALTISCTKKKIASTPIETSKIEIDQFLTNWHTAAADANYEDYFSPIAENGIYVGTDEAEVWTKQEFSAFAKPFFDKGRAWDFTAINRNIYQKGDGQTYYFNETLTTWMGVCRGSGIIQKNEHTGKLEILQYVLSLTVPNESIRDVMDTIEKAE